MSKSIAKKVSHDVDEALDDVVRELRNATEAAGEDAEATLRRAAEALSKVAQKLAADARHQSKALTKSAVKEAKAHPVAATAIAVPLRNGPGWTFSHAMNAAGVVSPSGGS